MTGNRPNHVWLYGNDHSPWVQSVLLGLHEKQIPHTVELAPPLSVFRSSGVLMPAAKIDEELERTIDAVRAGLKVEDARWIVTTVRQRGRNAVARLIPPLAEALASLDDEQRALLAERLAERNQEMRRARYVDASREERLARGT